MADSLEIRLEQLTQAIKGLYAKSSTTQGEIYNALTNLFARYENMTNLSNEKMASFLMEEFHKAIEYKYGQTNAYLKNLEDNIKGFMGVVQNPKTSNDLSQLLSDTQLIASKINQQEAVFKNVINSLSTNDEGATYAEIKKLSENFIAFSNGFEGITEALNKNFAEFFNQLKEKSSREDTDLVVSKIEEMGQNIAPLITSLTSIDDKYKDLVELINILNVDKDFLKNIQNDVSEINTGISETKNAVSFMTNGFEDIKNTVNNSFSGFEEVKSAVGTLVSQFNNINELKEGFENSKTGFEGIKNSINSTNTKIENLQNDINNSNSKIEEVKSVLAGTTLAFEDLKGDFSKIDALKNAFSKIDAFANEINSFSNNFDEIKTTNQASDFKIDELKNILLDVNTNTQGLKSNLSRLEEIKQSVSNAILNVNEMKGALNASTLNLEEIKSGISQNLEEIKTNISKNLNDVQGNISEFNNAFNNIKTSQDNVLSAVSGVKDDISGFSLNLFNAKAQIQNILSLIQEIKDQKKSAQEENSLLLLENSAKETLDILKQYTQTIDEKFEASKEDISKSINEPIKSVKEDVQKIIENMEGTQNYISKLSEILQSKDNFNNLQDALKIDINAINEAFSNKIQNLHNEFKNFENSLKDISSAKLDELIQNTETIKTDVQTGSQNTAHDIRKLSSGLTETIAGANTAVKNEIEVLKKGLVEVTAKQTLNLEAISQKFSELENSIEKTAQGILSNSQNTSSLDDFKVEVLEQITGIVKSNRDSISQFGAKVDRANLQQIHNAKELLEEIQTTTNSLSLKIDSFEDNKKLAEFGNEIAKLTSKMEVVSEPLEKFADKLKEFKEELEAKYKESVQKIGVLIQKESTSDARPSINIDNLTNKVQEYISNFEYLKGNISQEIREGLDKDFTKIRDQIKRLYSKDENPSYDYNLEDIETDLANIRLSIEKNVATSSSVESLYSKMNELRTVGLENVKISRDTEKELEHVSGWFKDINEKIVEITRKIDDIQNNGFEEIKTRILQSEKSKTASTEHASRVERALNILLNNDKKLKEKN
ncbi:hypothetical protein IJ670_05475 [bacterium]|nr:hypothetical protein [bacterium]